MNTVTEMQGIANMDEARTMLRPASQYAPKEDWVRGTCPQCGAPLVSNMYYVGGRGYICIWDCWDSLGIRPTCSYKKVI